ncbi:MAG: glycosyltransferase [Erythrobacter sp.]|uniref:glycosyltransferase n=1 Tax=Erythrobacter sp. TaxID=1042 RepID=UPI003299E01D
MTNRILHVSADFSDPIERFKTPVIKSFLGLTACDFDHSVVSINRVSPSLSNLTSLLLRPQSNAHLVQNQQLFSEGIALEYAAPGKGLFHRSMLERLGGHIAQIATSQDKPFDLLVGHKLTIEGIAVARAAEIAGIPYALTIQGNSDRKILKARPDLRDIFRSIYQNASMVCTFTPVARNAIERMLGKRKDGIALIPCPTELDAVVEPKVTGGDLISVFHLKNHKVKNLEGLTSAASRLRGKAGDRTISILGGGSPAQLTLCKDITAEAKQFLFAGPVDRNEMPIRMNEACALVVPSRAESFGLVFIEALFAGLPIIYPKGTAIDGYFDDLSFALAVDARSPQSISEAMERAILEESEIKQRLAEWQQSGASERFTRTAIARNYKAALQSALVG